MLINLLSTSSDNDQLHNLEEKVLRTSSSSYYSHYTIIIDITNFKQRIFFKKKFYFLAQATIPFIINVKSFDKEHLKKGDL